MIWYNVSLCFHNMRTLSFQLKLKPIRKVKSGKSRSKPWQQTLQNKCHCKKSPHHPQHLYIFTCTLQSVITKWLCLRVNWGFLSKSLGVGFELVMMSTSMTYCVPGVSPLNRWVILVMGTRGCALTIVVVPSEAKSVTT